jgi:hypothetical protein
MHRSVQLGCAWCGYLFAAFFVAGALGIVHWVPPLSPADSALATATEYRDRAGQIRLGFLVVFVGQIAFPLFGAAIAEQTRRIRTAPRALSYAQVASVGCASMAMCGPIATFFVAAFRPERAPEATQLLNDLAWVVFMVSFVPFVSWAFAIGAAVLCDTTDTPVYPRWSGYLCIVVGLVQMPAGLLIFFKTGPFAWNGIIGYWIPVIVFAVGMSVTCALMHRRARYETGSVAPAGGDVTDSDLALI